MVVMVISSTDTHHRPPSSIKQHLKAELLLNLIDYNHQREVFDLGSYLLSSPQIHFISKAQVVTLKLSN